MSDMTDSPKRWWLLVLLPCAGFAAAWALERRGGNEASSTPPRLEPVPARVERRPVQPEPAAALRPGPDSIPSAAGDAGWVELNNEATTDLTRGDLAAAIEKLERCLAAEPQNPVFSGNLVEALVRLARREHERGQLESAIEHISRAIELGSARPDLEVLRRLLERWQKEFELGLDDWTEGSSRFELTYDTDRADILRRSHEVLEHLELAYEDLVRWFGTDPLAGAPPTRVVLYEPEDFDRLTGLGDWAGGVFDGVVRVSVRDLDGREDWRSVLKHELVHAFVQAIAGNRVPGWLNEGLAQRLEGRPGELARLGALLQGHEPFPLERLEGSLATWEDRAEIARAYAQSLLFVEHLARGFGDEVLRRTLLQLAEGGSVAQAFERHAGVALELAFQDWRRAVGR